MKYIALITLIFVCVSCDLFTTRSPETPNTQGNGNIPATTPDILFSNLKTSISSKVLENYLACLVDTTYLKKRFRFFPSSGSTSQYPVLNGWNYDSERQYFKNLIAYSKSGQTVSLSLINNSVTQLGDSAIYQIDYTLSFQSNDTNLTGDYKGSLQFKIFLDSRNQWVIAEWNDYKKENLQSWSELKGKLY
jgi:hypothetical protein